MAEYDPNLVLTCPYTGATVLPQYTPYVGWVAKGAYDPCDWQSLLKLKAALRAGTPGRGTYRCAYTGSIARIVQRDSYAKADGVLCPGVVWEEKRQLLYDLSQRPGKLPDFERDPRQPKLYVGDVRRPESNPAQGFEGRSSAAVDRIVKGILPG